VQQDDISYVNSLLRVISATDPSGTAYYVRDNSGQLVDEHLSSGVYYYLFDGLGSVVGLTDSSGKLVQTYQYDPYSNLTSSTGTVINPWRFAGRYYDSTTGY
jgi:YD repeat-containing protein